MFPFNIFTGQRAKMMRFPVFNNVGCARHLNTVTLSLSFLLPSILPALRPSSLYILQGLKRATVLHFTPASPFIPLPGRKRSCCASLPRSCAASRTAPFRLREQQQWQRKLVTRARFLDAQRKREIRAEKGAEKSSAGLLCTCDPAGVYSSDGGALSS